MDSNTMVVKREVVATLNTRGWHYIKQIAEEIVQRMERDAIDEEDDVKGNALRREAKAGRKFLNEYLSAVEHTRQLDSDIHQFVEVAFE